MDHDVGAVADRLAEVRRGKRVVDHQWDAVIVGDRRHRLEVDHVEPRIGDGLDEDRLQLGPQRGAEVGRFVGLDERHRCPIRLNVTANWE